jgi:hypothetical protein
MLPKPLFHEAKYNRSNAKRVAKLVSAAGTSLSVLHFGCVVALICVSLKLNAQVPSDAQQYDHAHCEANVVAPPKVTAPTPVPEPPLKLPGNIQDGTRAALACEWIDPAGVYHVLRAFELLATNLPAPDLGPKVVRELQSGDPYPIDDGLYTASSIGDRNFLDTLAKANTLKKKKPEDQDALFALTQTIIDEIFDHGGQGKLDLVRINASFSAQENYVALFQLLNAYVSMAYGNQPSSYIASQLELLRAAFEMNYERLAKQVAGKITSVKD